MARTKQVRNGSDQPEEKESASMSDLVVLSSAAGADHGDPQAKVGAATLEVDNLNQELQSTSSLIRVVVAATGAPRDPKGPTKL